MPQRAASASAARRSAAPNASRSRVGRAPSAAAAAWPAGRAGRPRRRGPSGCGGRSLDVAGSGGAAAEQADRAVRPARTARLPVAVRRSRRVRPRAPDRSRSSERQGQSLGRLDDVGQRGRAIDRARPPHRHRQSAAPPTWASDERGRGRVGERLRGPRPAPPGRRAAVGRRVGNDDQDNAVSTGRPSRGFAARRARAGGREPAAASISGAGESGAALRDVVDGLGDEQVAVHVDAVPQPGQLGQDVAAAGRALAGSAASTRRPSQVRRPACSARSRKALAQRRGCAAGRRPPARPRGPAPRPRCAPARTSSARRAASRARDEVRSMCQRPACGSLSARSRISAAASACGGDGACSRPPAVGPGWPGRGRSTQPYAPSRGSARRLRGGRPSRRVGRAVTHGSIRCVEQSMVAVSSRARRSTGTSPGPRCRRSPGGTCPLRWSPACRSLALTLAIHVSSRPGAARGAGSARAALRLPRETPADVAQRDLQRAHQQAQQETAPPEPQFVLLELRGVGEPGGMLPCDLDEPLQQDPESASSAASSVGTTSGKVTRPDA